MTAASTHRGVRAAACFHVEVACEVGVLGVAHRHAHEPTLRVLRPPGLDGPVERGLARLVGAEAEVPAAHADRGEEDDDAVLAEVRQRGLGDERGADGVGRDHPLPRVGVDVLEGRQRRHPGGVQERVDAAHGVDRLADQLAAPLGVGDVGGDRGPGAGAGHDLGQLLGAAADHGDPGAGLGRGQGRAAPDAGGATDDEDPLPGEVDVDVLAAHGQATSSTSAEPMPPPAHIETTPWVAPRRRSSLIMVTTMRAPVAAIGWPRLQPLPLTFTIVGSMPSVRTAATGTEQNASLISKRSMSSMVRPARSSAFGIASVGPMPVRAGSRPDDAHDTTRRQRAQPMGLGVVVRGHHERGGGVVEARRVARGDGRAVDLRVQGLELGERLHGGAAPRMLVDAEHARVAVAVGVLDGDDLLFERTGVDGRDGTAVAVRRPLVDVEPGEPHLAGRVLAHRDRHVERRRVGGLGMAGRHPHLGLPARLEHLPRLRRRAEALGATGDDDPVHAGPDAAGADLHRAQAGGAVPVVGHAGDPGEAEAHGDVAGDVTPALQRLAEHDVVDVGGVDAGATHGLTDRDLRQAECVDVDERSLAGPPDRGAGGSDDDGFGHDSAPERVAVDPPL